MSILRDKASPWKCSILFVWILFLRGFKAQEPLNNIPNQSFQTNIFSASASFRQDVCHLQSKYENNMTSLEESLKGFSIRAALICPGDYCFLTKDGGGLDPKNPGLFAVLLDELAQRAGFSWRDSFALVNDKERGNKSYTELYSWMTETYDLTVDWCMKTTDRIRIGIDYPEGWYDSSIIMVGKISQEDTAFNPFTWILPFTKEVWFLIVATIVVSGLVYFLLEKIDHRSDEQGLHNDPIESIFISGIAFTTHFEFQPRTKPAWLFTLSVSFWAMLTASAYTANLASFLVVQNTPKLAISTLQDAVDYGYKICIFNTSATDHILSKAFKNGNFIRKDSNESFFGIINGQCDIAAVTVGEWETMKRNSEIGCKLEWIGRKYEEMSAGFTTRHDARRKCTSLVTDVIDIHLRDMLADGFVDTAWENHTMTTGSASATCNGTNSEPSSLESARLNLHNMGGIFILHFVIMVIAIALTLISKVRGRTEAPKEWLQKEETEQSSVSKGSGFGDSFRPPRGIQENVSELQRLQRIQSQSMADLKKQMESMMATNKKQMASIFKLVNQSQAINQEGHC